MKNKRLTFIFQLVLIGSFSLPSLSLAREYHVAITGKDHNNGSASAMLRTISEAAKKAKPGDTITVHGGIYRERINPSRGGESDTQRIIYQAAPGETPIIKGSEIVKNWEKVEGDTWKAVIANKKFGKFNPYADEIKGDWFNPKGRKHHTGAVYLNGHWLTEAAKLEEVTRASGESPLWFAKVNQTTTVIWAQFPKVNPNDENIEINVRQSIFYPEKPGVDYITVRGFTMEHAATPWAPPTAEQIGLIGTHWSKGWVIENNTIRYSTCVGVTLGKYGDQWDNTSENSAQGYIKTIERGLKNGWSKKNIGHHQVRNNHISHCEQGGIVGSLGAVFSTISHNKIHDIHVRRLFTGHEMAGIKIHAPLDTEISGNHIYRTCRGVWLDWMTQGTRLTRNFLHDNGPQEDLFIEVNHGPFLIDHNICLSKNTLRDVSEGGAYVHNLFAGKFFFSADLQRDTPWQVEHGTGIAGQAKMEGGDNRFYNNLLIGPSADLSIYDKSAHQVWMSGNVFLKGAKPSKHEKSPLILPDADPAIKLTQKANGTYLHINLNADLNAQVVRKIITSTRLGKTKLTGLPYVQPDGSPYILNRDYSHAPHIKGAVFPGPIEMSAKGKSSFRIWSTTD